MMKPLGRAGVVSESAAELPTLEAIREAGERVYQAMPPTPQYCWPLLSERVGAEVWVKHENHTPTGAFKVRGGLVLLNELKHDQPDLPGVITATKGNHGQSIAYAAHRLNIPAVIVVPRGNSVEKSNAIRAMGAELIEHGEDFQAALEFAGALSEERGLIAIPPTQPCLIRGVATYSLEFLSSTPELDTVYIPIGMGSGFCAMVAARRALNLKTKIVGVVSAHAPAYALSFEQGKPVAHAVSTKYADGLACRQVDDFALSVVMANAERVVRVTDDEVASAMRCYFGTTHNVAEGAGAASLAALLQEKDTMAGKRAGVVLTGGNVDKDLFSGVLSGTSA